MKYSDAIVDREMAYYNLFVGTAGGITYGVLISYMMLRYSPTLSSLWLGMVIGVLLSRKIDHVVHGIAIATSLFVLAVYGFPKFELLIVVPVVIGDVVDNIGNKMVDKGRLSLSKNLILTVIFKHRLLLDIIILVLVIITQYWIIFFTIVLFDGGYQITSNLINIKSKQNKKSQEISK